MPESRSHDSSPLEPGKRGDAQETLRVDVVPTDRGWEWTVTRIAHEPSLLGAGLALNRASAWADCGEVVADFSEAAR